MALTTPILYDVPAFDATKEQVFTFISIGGSQVVANKLTIKNNTTLATIYSQSQTTFRFEHTLPANTLINGTYYQATLTTMDAEGNESTPSNPIQFYCYSEPTFTISNMPNGNVVTNSSFIFNATYNQTQGEILNAYVFNLYNASGVLISTSGTKYNTSDVLPLIVSHTFSGFDDRASYFVQATGVTVNGTQLDTGKIAFTTKYVSPNTFSILYLSNNCKGGYITIESNIVSIKGKSNPDPPIYIDGKEVDLRQPDSYVEWDEGYKASGDWTTRLWGRDFTPNEEILKFSNLNGDNIVVTYMTDKTHCWFELRVVHTDDIWGYVIESQHIALPTDTEQIFMWLRRISNIYELKIENRGVEV